MPCVVTLLYIIVAVFVLKLIWAVFQQIAYRREVDKIIRNGEGSPERIEFLIVVLGRNPMVSKRDLYRIEKLRAIRKNMRRGVKKIRSRVVDNERDKAES